MVDDDDWDTDPAFENNMTEAERRRAGSVEQLNELSSSRGAMSMEAFRERALTTNEQAGQKD